MELAPPTAFSDLMGRQVTDTSGRSLGNVYEIGAHWEPDGTIVLDELLLGRRALLRRLRGLSKDCPRIPWEAIVEMERERIVVRI